MHTYPSQYCETEKVSFQCSVGDDRLINEQWRAIPEWIESVIAVRPMMRLEHCHIATLDKVYYFPRTNEVSGKGLQADNNEQQRELELKERE